MRKAAVQMGMRPAVAMRASPWQEDLGRSCRRSHKQPTSLFNIPNRITPRPFASVAAALPQVLAADLEEKCNEPSSINLAAPHPLPLPLPPPLLTLGYACDNMTLRRSHHAFTNRGCHKSTFEARGLAHVSTLALENCRDLTKILRWNAENNVRLFRVSSKLFPWAGHYPMEALPEYAEIAAELAAAGQLARASGQRLTSHPAHFIKLASTDEEIRRRSVADLEVHSSMFDLMGFPPSHWNKINIHVGGTYGSKPRALARFADTFETLSAGLRARLAVENDDRANSYSVTDLLALNSATGVPITFDFHHHRFCPGGVTQKEAFEAAIQTWPQGVRPVVHWSEPPECPELAKTHPYAHSAFVYGPIELYGREGEVDVMIESKAKEKALQMYRDELAPRLVQRGAAAVRQESELLLARYGRCLGAT